MAECVCGAYHCKTCGNQATPAYPGTYKLDAGDYVELSRPLTVKRRTRAGLILCEIYGREISLPEYFLVYKGLVTGQHLPPVNEKPAVKCDHEWVDATNEVVKSGEICFKCYSVRPSREKTDGQ